MVMADDQMNGTKQNGGYNDSKGYNSYNSNGYDDPYGQDDGMVMVDMVLLLCLLIVMKHQRKNKWMPRYVACLHIIMYLNLTNSKSIHKTTNMYYPCTFIQDLVSIFDGHPLINSIITLPDNPTKQDLLLIHETLSQLYSHDLNKLKDY